MHGQDDETGTRTGTEKSTRETALDEASALQKAPRVGDGERTRDQVKLRLTPAIAAALRTRAEERRATQSDYVAGLILMDEVASVNSESPTVVGLTEVSVLAQAVHQLPLACKELRSELGRQGGLLKHLAEQNKLGNNDEQIAETLREILKTAQQADTAIIQLLTATAETRADLERAARMIAGR